MGANRMSRSLGEELPIEIERVSEICREYESIGVAGSFAAAMMRKDIKDAVNAIAIGDVVAMIKSYETLKEYSL